MYIYIYIHIYFFSYVYILEMCIYIGTSNYAMASYGQFDDKISIIMLY